MDLTKEMGTIKKSTETWKKFAKFGKGWYRVTGPIPFLFFFERIDSETQLRQKMSSFDNDSKRWVGGAFERCKGKTPRSG